MASSTDAYSCHADNITKNKQKKMKSHFIFGILAENTQEAELETADIFVILLIA